MARISFSASTWRGHRIPPSELNFRANVDAMKRAGVTEILFVSACGSFKEELPPGTFVICDQFIDRTFAREVFLWDWASRSRGFRASYLFASGSLCPGGLRRIRHTASDGGHLPRNGGAAVLDVGGIRALPVLGV